MNNGVFVDYGDQEKKLNEIRREGSLY